MSIRCPGLLILAVYPLLAQPPLPVMLGNPNAGQLVVTGSEAFFNQADDTVLVTATPSAGDYVSLVNGLQVTLQPNGLYGVVLPLGPQLPAYMQPYANLIGYLSALLDPHRIQKPVVFEKFHTPTSQVVERKWMTIWDLRKAPGFNGNFSKGLMPDGMRASLSYRGLNALEPTYLALSPHPSLESFNQTLTSQFAGIIKSASMDTSYSNNNKVCISMNQIPPAFLTTAATLGVVAIVAAMKTNAVPCASLPLLPGNFELCIPILESNSSQLALSSLAAVSLDVGNAGKITSGITLDRVDGAVDVNLKDLFVRWKGGDCTAGLPPLPQPQLPLIAADYGKPEVADWIACRNLELDRAGGRTLSLQNYLVSPAVPASLETLNVTGSWPTPLFRLLGPNLLNTAKNGCADQVLQPHVQSLVASYQMSMQSALDAAWKLGDPVNAEANLLNSFFDDWEIGRFRSQGIDLRIPPGQVNSFPGDRFNASFNFKAVSPNNSPPTMLHFPPSFPCSGQSCNTGRGPKGDPYHFSYSVSTNVFNYLTSERLGSLQYEPTFADLNLNPPPGGSPTDTFQVNATYLSNLFPPFASLGSTKVRMIVSPIQIPFVRIPDGEYYFANGVRVPLPAPPGRQPIPYQATQLRVVLRGNQPGPGGSNIWVDVLLSFYDPDLQVELDPVPSNRKVIVSFSPFLETTATLIQSQLTSCNVQPINTQTPGTCGAGLTSLIAGWITGDLQAKLIDMLQGVPAPQQFFFGGRLAPPLGFTYLQRFTDDQVVSYYGDFTGLK